MTTCQSLHSAASFSVLMVKWKANEDMEMVGWTNIEDVEIVVRTDNE